jgi:hypothetical protein
MRALIAGRQTVIDEKWDEPDAVSDVGDPDRPFDSISRTLDRPGSGRGELGLMATVLAPNDLEGEATRIELNPMMEDEQLTVSHEPEPQRRSGILPLPPDPNPEPETLLGGDLAPSGARRSTSASGLRKVTPAPGRTPPPTRLAPDDPGAQDTLAMSSFEESSSGRTPAPVPAPPRLPDSDAVARGRGHPDGEFGAEKTAPAGPLGLRGRTPGPEGMSEDLPPADDAPGGIPAALRSGAYPGPQNAEPAPMHVEYPTSGSMERPVSGPMERPVSGPMERPVSGPMSRSGSGPMRRPGPGTGPMPRLSMMWGADSARMVLNRRTVPVWLLVVLFVISIGVGLGATLLINALFF